MFVYAVAAFRAVIPHPPPLDGLLILTLCNPAVKSVALITPEAGLLFADEVVLSSPACQQLLSRKLCHRGK